MPDQVEHWDRAASWAQEVRRGKFLGYTGDVRVQKEGSDLGNGFGG